MVDQFDGAELLMRIAASSSVEGADVIPARE